MGGPARVDTRPGESSPPEPLSCDQPVRIERRVPPSPPPTRSSHTTAGARADYFFTRPAHARPDPRLEPRVVHRFPARNARRSLFSRLSPPRANRCVTADLNFAPPSRAQICGYLWSVSPGPELLDSHLNVNCDEEFWCTSLYQRKNNYFSIFPISLPA
jgi:hypothetical protein